MALIQRDGDVRAMEARNVSGATLKDAIRNNVTKDSTIVTDEHLGYVGLNKEFAAHKVDEFAFRYNRRNMKDGERAVSAIKSIEGKRLYYKSSNKYKDDNDL